MSLFFYALTPCIGAACTPHLDSKIQLLGFYSDFANEQDSDGGEDWAYAVAMPGNNNSAVLAGKTSGNWSGTNAGEFDQAAVMVDSDGNEVWRWQASE